MATAFSIGSPTVIATLPRPIDRSNGRYVVSDVYGGNRGLRKRKRAELAVGVDGEGLSIYDVRERILIKPTVANLNIDKVVKAYHFLCAASAVIIHLPAMLCSKKIHQRWSRAANLCFNHGHDI